MTSTGVRRIGWLGATLVLLALLVLAVRRIDLTRAVAELSHANMAWLVAAALAYAIILPLWALQWHILSPPAPRNAFPTMLSVVSMTSLTLNTTPLLIGEAAGVVLLVARAGLDRASALSVLAMDQVLVGLAKVTVVSIAALTVTLPPWIHSAIPYLGGGVAVLLALTLIAAWQYSALAARAERSLLPRLANALVRMGRALEPLRSPARGGSALAIALAKKAVEVLAILMVQRAFGVSLPIASAVLVLAALNLATLLPLVPANVGVYEGAVVLAYMQFGVSAELALGMAVLQHCCYFVALSLPGYVWFARAALPRPPNAAAAS